MVVDALARAGLTDRVAAAISWAAAGGRLEGILVTGGLVAALSAAANNLPTALIAGLAAHATDLPPPVRRSLALAVVVGYDVAAKFAPVGSLALLLWLDVLRRRDLTMPSRRYLAAVAIATVPVRAAALTALWAVSGGR